MDDRRLVKLDRRMQHMILLYGEGQWPSGRADVSEP